MKTVRQRIYKYEGYREDIEDSGAEIQNRNHFYYIDRQRQYEEVKQY